MNDFPRIAPPADGLALAMGAARSRRLRKASASSGVSALALTMVAVLAGTSGRSTLSQQPTPEQPAVVVNVVPDGQKRPVDQGTRPSVVLPLTSSGTSSPLDTTPPAATVVAAAPPSTTLDFSGDHRSSGISSKSAPHVTGPMKSEQQTTSPSDVSCPVNKSANGEDVVCPEAFAMPVYASGNSSKVVGYTLETYVCNYTPRTYVLSYASQRELDVVIRNSKGNVVWRWSLEHPDQDKPHALALLTGNCWYWETSWSMVDQQGRAVPKGDYTMVSLQKAVEMAHTADATSDFTLS